MPTVTVLLCVRNGAATLERQLAALAAQDTARRLGAGARRQRLDRPRPRRSRALVVTDPGMRDRGRAAARRQPGAQPRACRPRTAQVVVCCDADDEVAPVMAGRDDASARSASTSSGGRARSGEAQRSVRAHRGGDPARRAARACSAGATRSARASASAAPCSTTSAGSTPTSTSAATRSTSACAPSTPGATIGFAPDAVVHYRVKDTARAVMRQRFSYGRGHQLLVAEARAPGHIESRPIQRWKVVAVSAVTLVRPLAGRSPTGARACSTSRASPTSVVASRSSLRELVHAGLTRRG